MITWKTITYSADNIVDLGSHAELTTILYSLEVESTYSVEFSLHAGKMPAGMSLNRFGSIQGTPVLGTSSVITVDLNGVPMEVPQEEEFIFVIRATEKPQNPLIPSAIADQTFRLIITGEDPPIPFQNAYVYIFNTLDALPNPYSAVDGSSPTEYIWLNKVVYVADIGDTEHSGSAYICTSEIDVLNPPNLILSWQPYNTANNVLGSFTDGTWIDISIAANDPDPDDVIVYDIVKGAMPDGLTLVRETGQIYGYVEPAELNLSSNGYSSNPYDVEGFAEEENAKSKTYQFTVRVDDGKMQVLQDYQLIINRLDLLTADTIMTSADTIIITTDNAAKHLPVLYDRNVDIGFYLDDNFFAYKFDGHDFDGDEIGYEILPNAAAVDPFSLMPAEITINETTGWLYGYIDPLTIGQDEFNFDVRVYKTLYEPNPVQFLVDYSINYPFNYTNGRTQAEMDALYINDPNTDYDGKLFVFRQQEAFDMTAFPNAQPLDDDGWQDLLLNTIDGWDEHQFAPSTVENQRAGVWRCVLVPQPDPTPNYYEFEFVEQVEINQIVRSIRHIVSDPTAIVVPGEGDPSPLVSFYTNIKYAETLAGPPEVPEYTTDGTRNPFATTWTKRLVIENSNNYNITWITDTLSPMTAGKPVTVQFEASNISNSAIVYSISSGQMPQGLQLNSNGMLEGRPSVQHFKFIDDVTFDKGLTTFDKYYTFTVTASTTVNDPIQRTITSTKSFTVYVNYPTAKPTNDLYLEFLLPQEDRDLLLDKLYDDTVVPQEYIYRYDDFRFGIQDSFKMLIGYGLNPTSDGGIARAIAAYHHKKNYLFRDLKLARSLDANGNVEFEVIYIEPRDDFTTDTASWLGSILLTINDYTEETTVDEDIQINTELVNSSQLQTLEAYPASEPNMQQNLKDRVSDFSLRYLPSWMLSRQTNGKISYWIPAIPVLYVKPGLGQKVLYNLSQANIELNSINAQTDRYYWDNGMGINWDLENDQFYSNTETTFDQLIRSADYTIVDEVDYAVDVPFYRINANVKRNIELEGVLDGARTISNGMKILFVKQEQFDPPIEFDDIDGWGDMLVLNDDGEYELSALESYAVVPGYDEKIADMSGLTLNQRAGIWEVVVTDGLVRLEFVREINLPESTYSIIGQNADPDSLTIGDNFVINATTITLTGTTVASVASDINTAAITGVTATVTDGKITIIATVNVTIGEDATPVGNALSDLGLDATSHYLPTLQAVYVKRGLTYGGTTQVFVPAVSVSPSATVPAYVDQTEVNTTLGTIFDDNAMQFIDFNLDVYINQDEGAKYLVFEKDYYLDYGIVDV